MAKRNKSNEHRKTQRTSQHGAQRSWGGSFRVALVATGAAALIASAGFVASAAISKPRGGPKTKKLLVSGRQLGPEGAGATTTVPSTTTTSAPPLPYVASVSPLSGATGVAAMTPITITLSAPPAPGSPMPELSPPAEGTWSVSGTVLTFTPSKPLAPWTEEHVTVPVTLAQADQWSYTVEGVQLLRIQQVLAELHYLPLRFGPSVTQSALDAEPTVASEVPTAPQPGEFTWRYADIPASLAASWAPGSETVLTQGAVMMFENEQGLTVDGIAGPAVWTALTKAVAARSLDPNPYDYLMVSESLPENLTVWRDGQDIYSSPANTGVNGANTPLGTWPVYEHIQSSTMTGTDVDGYRYNDPDVPWVAYFYEGDAVHGYPRASYGYPQSNGCVELPIANAQQVWPMDPIGTLVTVAS